MLKPMLKLVRKDEQQEEEDRGLKTPALLLAARTGLLRLVGRVGRAGRGYALAGAGVVAAAVVAVSLLSWLAPDSDRPMASPLEAVGRGAGGVIEQVDDQVGALLLGGTDGQNTVLRSVREGLVAASSATPWPSGNPDGIASSPSSSTASPDSASSSTDDAAAAPSRSGESSSASDGTSSQPVSSTPSPSSPSETPTTMEDAPSPPTASEPAPPAPPASEEPPVAEEPATPPPSAEPPPAAEDPVPPSTEEPSPATEEPPPPVEGPPETRAD